MNERFTENLNLFHVEQKIKEVSEIAELTKYSWEKLKSEMIIVLKNVEQMQRIKQEIHSNPNFITELKNDKNLSDEFVEKINAELEEVINKYLNFIQDGKMLLSEMRKEVEKYQSKINELEEFKDKIYRSLAEKGFEKA